MSGVIAILLGVAGIGFYVVVAFILWKFYDIASQIKNELLEIKGMMRDRMNPPTGY